MPTKEEVEERLRQVEQEKAQLQRKYERVKTKLTIATVIVDTISQYLNSDHSELTDKVPDFIRKE